MTDKIKRPRQPHPMQPIVMATDKVIRFQANAIVRWLLDVGGMDMNTIAQTSFAREDREQFAQLIGYSVSGYGELPYVRRAVLAKADRIADALVSKKRKTRA